MRFSMQSALRIWFIAIVHALFLFPACKSTTENTVKAQLPNDTTTANAPPLFNDLSGEARFFKIILAKYPDDFFPIGSGGFMETFSRDSGKLHWKFSFMEMDSTQMDEKKYLVEVSDSTIRKMLPDAHFYSGKHTHHWEIGGEASFYGFVNKYTADFIYDRYEDGYSPAFKQMIGTITFKDEAEKTLFRAAFQERFLIDPFKQQ